ncbi:MAG TPA: hypothetical protein VNM45_15495 [Bacillus sp. (in: firmicutes)]|nr:hypothetical protein [Bacillus sp. (in: firmicutes)]
MAIKLILFFVASIIVGFFQIKPLIQKNMKKEVWVYSFLYLLAVFVASLMLIGIPIPNPLDLLEWIYRPLAKPLLSSITTMTDLKEYLSYAKS